MCGICGVVSADTRQVEPAVRRMMQAMVHRGPDDDGFVELPLLNAKSGPAVGLGFRRLSILDLSLNGHQPMVNSSTGDWLVFNGEVYNFRTLRAELSGLGVIFRGTSDSEVVLHALSRWKEQALPKLQGMFALAFYDSVERRLLLARDPLGIKPLYVAELPDRFVFASEIQALRSSGLVPLDFDVAGIAGMLAYGAVQSPRTVFEKIRSFPAGSYQWFDAGVVSGRPQPAPRRYWSFPDETTSPPPADAAAEVSRLLREAVQRHLVADVPLGVLLSAGIDSTVLAAYAREFSCNLTAFTVGFDSPDLPDERAAAASTAATIGVRHVPVHVDSSTLPALWHDWLATLDSPSIDGFNTRIVSRAIAREGVVVGLSGLGADELFGGYPSFRRAPQLAKIVRAMGVIPRQIRSSIFAQFGRLDGREGAFEKLADLMATDGSVAGMAQAMRRTLSDRRLASLRLDPTQLALSHHDSERNAGLSLKESPIADAFNTVSRIESVHYMGDTLLRDTDANSMHHGLEVRVPFLDLPLVNYVSALPGSVKRSAGSPPKLLLRQACAHVLPAEIASRPKTGFTLPIGSWMRGELREQCEPAIAAVEQLPFLDGREVRRLWALFQAKPRALHWSRPLSLVVLGAQLAQPSAASLTTAWQKGP
jgi:asparagine synthase (glutamine-hydrolysing)